MNNYTMFVRSGQKIDPFNLRPDQVLITDIAHSLSMQCRYNGHTTFFYSVAQHCWLLSIAMKEHSRELERAALLHDAAECYIGDMVQPLKVEKDMAAFKRLDNELTGVIFDRFGVDRSTMDALHPFDRGISIDEMQVLMPDVDPHLLKIAKPVGVNITEQNPRTAFNLYMQRFKELFPGEWPYVH
jgi:hypothetical protein